MQLSVWNPMRDMEDFFSRVQRGFGSRYPVSAGDSAVAGWAPAVDISETPKEYLVKAELPGVKREDVKITLDNSMLTLSGERREETDTTEHKVHRVERFCGSFERNFSLPDDVLADKISAEFKDGVLQLHLPKTDLKKSKSVEIKVQ